MNDGGIAIIQCLACQAYRGHNRFVDLECDYDGWLCNKCDEYSEWDDAVLRQYRPTHFVTRHDALKKRLTPHNYAHTYKITVEMADKYRGVEYWYAVEEGYDGPESELQGSGNSPWDAIEDLVEKMKENNYGR